MQEFKSQLAKVGFARRHLGKVATIGLAAVVARVFMPKPAKADWDDGRYWDRGDPRGHHCFLKGTKIWTKQGECVVEELAIGDLLPTHRNGVRPITWRPRQRRPSCSDCAVSDCPESAARGSVRLAGARGFGRRQSDHCWPLGQRFVHRLCRRD